MSGSRNGQPSKTYRGRQLSAEAVKFLEKVRNTKGVIDVWASGNDMTFVKLRNFKVVCLRGQSTEALDEQLREMNRMTSRSSSLGSGLNDLLAEPFRSRTRSELPPRPKNIRDIIKRRTSDTAAEDLELAHAKLSEIHQKETAPKESWNVMSKVDENLPLTTADIEQEHERGESCMRIRASSFGCGSRKLSPTMTKDQAFRHRTRSELPPRPARLVNSSKERNGYTDISVYFSYEKGLFIPPESDIKLISPRSSPNTVNGVAAESDRRGVEVKEKGSQRKEPASSSVSSSETVHCSPSKSALVSRQNSKKEDPRPPKMYSTKKRHSLPDVMGDESLTAEKYSRDKRHSLTGVVAFDSANIKRHTQRQYSNAGEIHPKTIAQAFNGLTIKKSRKGSGKSDFFGRETDNRFSLPANDHCREDRLFEMGNHNNSEKSAPQSSGILTFIRNLFTRKPDPSPVPPPPRYNLQPRKYSMDSQLLFHQLCLGRQTRNSVHEKAIKVSRPGHSRPMYLAAAKSLGGLPETEDDSLYPLSFPNSIAAKANINQLSKQGRRASCPVIFESEELEEASEQKMQDKIGQKLPRLWSADMLSKHKGFSTFSEQQSEYANISSQPEQCRDSQCCEKTDSSEESSNAEVEDDMEDCGATSELDGVTFIVKKRSTGGLSSSKSESSDVAEQVDKDASLNIASDDPTSSSESESQSVQNLRSVNGISSSSVGDVKSRKQPRKLTSRKQKKMLSASSSRRLMEEGKVKAVPPRLLSSKSWTDSSVSVSSATDDGMSSDRTSDVSSLTCSADESSD